MEFAVFISHHSADCAITDRVRRFTESIGLQPYLFENHPEAGEQLASKLVEAIRSSQAFVVVLTKMGSTRASVQQEVGAAVALGKPIFALVEDGVDVASFAMIQGIEFIRLNVERAEESIESLQRSIAAYRRKELSRLIWVLVLVALALGVAWAVSREG
jgi:nucleoside 2-deoxyribosyltransferase